MASGSDRGQAYTLEALIAALLLVTAVLFALQSVVITPTSAGTLDRDVQSQLQHEASDVLVTAANEGELSRMARYWDCSDGGFATQRNAGAWVEDDGYATDRVPVEDLASVLAQSFDPTTRYNVLLIYDNDRSDDVQNVSRLVYQGAPSEESVSASYMVTLTDDQRVTDPEHRHQTLADCNSPPIKDAHTGSTVYNVVEVRVVLW